MELLEIAKLPTAENSAIHLNPLDNVAVARVPLSAGMKLRVDGVGGGSARRRRERADCRDRANLRSRDR